MCRFVIYHGKRVLLSDILTKPEHSLISQASRRDAYTPGAENSDLYDEKLNNKRNHAVNADGFGLAYFDSENRLFASLFKSVTPAWSDQNLAELCEIQYTDLLFAHIRAASSNMLVSQANCHPFRRGQFVFMHNGAVSGFSQIRRNLLSSLNDDVFKSIRGTTDSEHAFALFLSQFQQEDVMGPEAAPDMMPAGQLKRLEPEEFVRGLRWTIIKIMELQKMSGISYEKAASSLNFAVSDGQVICVSRCRTHPTQDPPTLYYAYQQKKSKVGYSKSNNKSCSSGDDECCSRTLDVRCKKQTKWSPSKNLMLSESGTYNNDTNHVVFDGSDQVTSCIISSEPLDYTDECSGNKQNKWVLIPKDHMLLVVGNTIKLISLRLPSWDEILTVDATPCIQPDQYEPVIDDDFSLNVTKEESKKSIKKIRKNSFRPPLPPKLNINKKLTFFDGTGKRSHVGAFSAGLPVSPRTRKESEDKIRNENKEQRNQLSRSDSNNPTANRLRRHSEESRRQQQDEYRWQQSFRTTVLTSIAVGGACLIVGSVVGWLFGKYTGSTSSDTEILIDDVSGSSAKEARTDQILESSNIM
jgi:glutamine amidotransferase